MRRFGVVRYLFLLAVVPQASRGQSPDHLKCYRIKDTAPRATYVADLGGVEPEPGCVIRVPPKLVCVPSTKTNITPNPPGGGATGTPTTFFCYRVKCRKGSRPTFSGVDQFGDHTVTVLKSKLLCAPVTVTTTTTTTTTSASTMTGTTNTNTTCSAGPTTTGFYCGFNSCAPNFAWCPTSDGSVAPTCTQDCTCPPVPCGQVISRNLCQWGTCPPGMTCRSGTVNDPCASGCSCF